MYDKRFCVYLHKDENNVVRYVGEGTIVRAYSKSRSDQPRWMELFKNNPPIVEIVAENLEKEQSESLEIKVRNFYFDTIINDPYATKKMHEIDRKVISKYVRYDESSPTFLRWNNDMKNNAPKDSPAGYLATNKIKYCTVQIEGTSYGIHRVVWTLMVGEIPKGLFVDHIDGNKSNNNINNLRLVNPKENAHNKLLDKIPRSGYRSIREHIENGEVASYMVRWHELHEMKRNAKVFNVRKYGGRENAIRAAYSFRESLIERGCLSSRVKEGEIPPL